MTGASGFIGSHLVKFLLARDYAVIGLTRQKKLREEHPDFHWINDLEELKNHQIDYVINLAGESIGQGRWTAARKKKLLDSRLNTTKQLYDYLEKIRSNPNVLFRLQRSATTESIRKNAGIRCVLNKVRHNPFLCQNCVRNGKNWPCLIRGRTPKLFALL